MVRASLLRDRSFQSDLGLKFQSWYPLKALGSVELKSLHNAIRAALAGQQTASLMFKDNKRATATLEKDVSGRATITVSGIRFSFMDADLLAEDVDIRTAALERVFRERPLCADEESHWLQIARSRTYSDDEYEKLMTELGETPEALSITLRDTDGLDAEAMMPGLPQYYHRLTAKLTDAADLGKFRDGELRAERSSLMERHPIVGLRRAAFGAITRELMDLELFSSLELENVRTLLAANDPYSLVFGFELCCAGISGSGAFGALGEAFLAKLFDRETGHRRCVIFSGCAVIAMAEIRRAALASKAPVFWTRQAALAHAGVLADALAGIPDSQGFWEWAMQGFYPYYHWSGAIERRDDPCWRPEWVNPDVLYAQVLRRACEAYEGTNVESRRQEWFDLLEVTSNELRETERLVEAVYPGPLDGFFPEPAPTSLYVDAAELEAELQRAEKFADAPRASLLGFTSMPSEQTISEVSRLLKTDTVLASPQQSIAYLSLAVHMALRAGSKELSQAAIERCFDIVSATPAFPDIADLLAIIVEACAVYREQSDYRKKVGQNAARFSHYVNDQRDMAITMRSLDFMIRRDPRLAPSVAKARSMLRMKIGRFNA